MSHIQRHDQGFEGQLEEGVPAAKEAGSWEKVAASESSQETASSSASTQASASSKASKGSGGQAEGDQSTSNAYLRSKLLLNSKFQKKVTDLVKFLSIKYITNEPVTEAEIQKSVGKEHRGYYSLIFKHACECMEVVFGIEVKEVDALNHTYLLLKILDLTYDGRISNEEGIPKTGLLVLVLGVIFMEGNRASEKKIWEVLSIVGVYPDQHDFICGNPRKFITEDLVLENYLVYQPVPHSDPPTYEFLWGPRAQAETSKMKVLKFFCKVAGSNPASFAGLYKEALEDEEERARALLASTAISTEVDNSGSGDKPSGVSHSE
ncbi:putative MAGE domain-containing protein MAGEA13P [Mus pahari]|uniref:putative MAGE domain-containing protein MAGEA13P n=1 Tax=Mus pahari TaxID=10093 RepID=UPI000A30D168|nr:putative MAGE domain-containing protein MAGEA13P [Mus pahari]